MYIWLANGYIYYGLLYILPQTLEEENEYNLWDIAVPVITELPTTFIGFFLMEWLGRIKSMFISFLGLSLVLIPCAFFEVNDFFVAWVSISKFFMAMTFLIIYPYT